MRCVYIGNFLYPYTTENHIARSLEGLGVYVVRLQEDRTPIEDLLHVVKEASPALVLYTRTWGYDAWLTDEWRAMEKRGIVTASYHLDLYLGLERSIGIAQGDPFWTTQYVFTPDGDPASQIEFERLGINHHYMPPAIVADESYIGTESSRFHRDVVFVGSRKYHPEWPWRVELLDWLKDRYGPRFRRYGPGNEVVRGPHLNDLYASVNVVVGDSLCPGFEKPGYWSDRPYETVGRGGYLIMPHVPGLEAHFTDGEHLTFFEFGDFEQLGDLIEMSLEDPVTCDTIRRVGQAHVFAHHTYAHRLAEALRIMALRQ